MKILDEILKFDEQKNLSYPPYSDADGVISQLYERQLEAVLVLEGENLSGILRRGNSFRKVTLAKASFNETRLREFITRNLIATSPDLIARKCQALTRQNSIYHLPVVFDGPLLGIVSIHDLATVIL